MTITPNIDTKALRELRDDACKLDGHSLMEVLHAQQKYERAIINAAPALLDTIDALRVKVTELGGTCKGWHRIGSKVMAERDALKAEVERLRSDAEKGDYIPTSMYLQRCEELRTAQREAESVSHWIRLNDMATAKLSASEREAERLREALTPSGETKFAYMNEFKFNVVREGPDHSEIVERHAVPWTTLKDIMAAISKRAALRGEEAPRG